MTTDNTSAPTGGADWELGQASERMSDARVAYDANPTPEHKRAMRLAEADFAAALGSKQTQMIAGFLVPMLESQKRSDERLERIERAQEATRVDIATVAQQYVDLREWWETRYSYMLGQIDSFIKRADRQLTVYGEQIDQLRTDLDAFKEEQAVFNVGSQAHRARLEALILRLPQSEQLKVIKEVQRELRRIAVRQWLQFIPIAIVVFMLFVWAVVTLARMAP